MLIKMCCFPPSSISSIRDQDLTRVPFRCPPASSGASSGYWTEHTTTVLLPAHQYRWETAVILSLSRAHARTCAPTHLPVSESSESGRLRSLTFLNFRRAVRLKLLPFQRSAVQMSDQTARDRSVHVREKWLAGPDSLQTQPITSPCYLLLTRRAL